MPWLLEILYHAMVIGDLISCHGYWRRCIMSWLLSGFGIKPWLVHRRTLLRLLGYYTMLWLVLFILGQYRYCCIVQHTLSL